MMSALTPYNAFAKRRGFANVDRLKRPLPIAFAPRDLGPVPHENLARMEAAARACDAFGADLDFDATKWVIARGTTTSSRKQHSLWFTVLPASNEAYKSADKRVPLSPAFERFAKAVIRLVEHRQHHAPPTYDRLLRALRSLYAKQSARGTTDPAELRTSDFEEAETAEGYAADTRYALAVDLNTIADVCHEYRLTWARIDYEPSVSPPVRPPQTGPHDSSLPSPAVISALAGINARATALPDIAMMCPVRIIQFGHLRGAEVLALGSNCERFLVDGRETTASEYDAADPNRRHYGLFYRDVKTKRWGVKGIFADAVPIVRDAIATAKVLSAPSREIARHYATETGAWLPASMRDGQLYQLPELAAALWKSQSETNAWLKLNRVPVLEEAVSRADLEDGLSRTPAGWSRTRDLHMATIEFIRNPQNDHFTCTELTAALPVNDLRRWLRKMEVPVRPRSVARTDLERVLAGLQPPGDDLPQPLKDSLFLFPANFFASGRQVFMPVAELITVDQLRVWLRGSKHAFSVFYRYGYREENRKSIVVTAHAFRRWLTTEVAKGRISLAQLREWSGHRTVDAVRGYMRETEAEVADRVMEAFRVMNMESLPESWAECRSSHNG